MAETKFDIRLQDWQCASERAEGTAPSVDLGVIMRDDQIVLFAPDGRQVMIELEDGALRVHGYNALSEAPVNMEISVGEEITLDTHDYNRNRAPAPETGVTP